jgi:hypothetical protein
MPESRCQIPDARCQIPDSAAGSVQIPNTKYQIPGTDSDSVEILAIIGYGGRTRKEVDTYMHQHSMTKAYESESVS